MLAVGHAPRRVIPFCRYAPDRRVVSVLLVVDRDLHKGHARTVGRDLRIADPVELKDVFVGDRTLLRLGKSGNRRGTDGGDDEQAETMHGGSFTGGNRML